MRGIVATLVVGLLLSGFTVTGCTSGTTSSDLVSVPDVVSAVESHHFNEEYSDDPKIAAIALHAYVAGALESSRLEPDLVMVPGSSTDSQEPEPGTMVEPGTTVTVRIGMPQ